MKFSWFQHDPEARFLRSTVTIASLILFLYSSLRHFLLRSTAYDLGLFDSAIYRMSQGYKPLDTLHDLHIMGDHAAWIFYPISLLYRITPSVHWLFFIQAVGLASSTVPLWWLAKKHYNLSRGSSRLTIFTYLLYPVVFNANLFDFHPDVFAPLLIFSAMAMACKKYFLYFILILFVLSGCKAIFGLTIFSMGVWLCIEKKNYHCGVVAAFWGVAWFLIANKLIIPAISGEEATGIGRYSFLGNSLSELLINVLLKPQVVLQYLLTFENFKYLFLLVLPVAWGLSLKSMTPLIGALPSLFLNLLTTFEHQKSISLQYSLPIVPFLIIIVMNTLSHRKMPILSYRIIVMWILMCFLTLGKPYYFILRYFDEGFDTVMASREAIALMDKDQSVLVPSHIVPQVTHRLEKVQLIVAGSENIDLNRFENVFLDLEVPGIHTKPETIPNLLSRLQNDPSFELVFNKDKVFLYENISTP